jgi:hypothetical protein
MTIDQMIERLRVRAQMQTATGIHEPSDQLDWLAADMLVQLRAERDASDELVRKIGGIYADQKKWMQRTIAAEEMLRDARDNFCLIADTDPDDGVHWFHDRANENIRAITNFLEVIDG